MFYTFKDVFAQQTSVSDKKLIRKLLKLWIRYDKVEGARIVGNLLNESFLSKKDLERLIKSILKVAKSQPTITPITLSELKNKLSQEFYKNLQLKGGTIKINHPKVTGFVIPEGRIKVYLLKSLRWSMGEVDLFIQDLAKGWVSEKYKSLWIKDRKFLIWGTWNKLDVNGTPFVYQLVNTPTREVVRIFLGLGHTDYDTCRLMGIIVDSFSIQTKGGDWFRPTFCDADFDAFFRPGDPKIEHRFGLTEPLKESFFYEGRNIVPGKEPEAVIRSEYISYAAVKGVKIFF